MEATDPKNTNTSQRRENAVKYADHFEMKVGEKKYETQFTSTVRKYSMRDITDDIQEGYQ